MKLKWKVSRKLITRHDGQRRWDQAYQFLLRWAMEQEAGKVPASSNKEEHYNGNSLVCTCFDQHPTSEPYD